MPQAPVYTLDTTWTIQLDDGDGGWNWYSQVEYDNERECRELAARIYGGEVKTRLIRIDRTVVD